jgi:hypothetical protein
MKLTFFLLVSSISFQVFSQDSSTTLDFKIEDFSSVDIVKERAKLPWSTADIYKNLYKKDVIMYENTFMSDESEPKSFPFEMIIDKTYGNDVIKTSFVGLMQSKKEKNSADSKIFYPYFEFESFRVIDTKGKISTKAGEFECTIIEGVYETDNTKLWMINDMPGYYAKVLTVEGPEKDGLTIISELLEL